MHMFTDSFIVSNPEQNNKVSELHHCILLRIPSLSKRYCNKVVPTLDKQLLWQNLNTNKRDRKWFKIVQRNGLLVKEKIMLPKLLKLSHSFTFNNISTHSSFWEIYELFRSCECLKLPVVIRTAADGNRPIVYIWGFWKLIYTCLYYSKGIYLINENY